MSGCKQNAGGWQREGGAEVSLGSARSKSAYLLLRVCPSQKVVGGERVVPQLAMAWGKDREPVSPYNPRISCWGRHSEFPWCPLVGKRGIWDMAWAPGTLFLVRGHFEAELEPITEFMVEKKGC